MTQLPPPRRLENSKFYNNTEPKTLKNKFATILSNNSIINLDFLVGYLRISGFKHLYELIQNRLESFERIRILVGLSVDSAIAELTQAGIESHTAKAERFLEIFHNNQVQNIQDDAYQDGDTTDQSIQMLIDALKAGKIQMRIVKDKNVHAKFYVFSQEPLPDHTSSTPSCSYTGSLIIGSSNLSDNGLVSQYEFNAELNQSADIETALYEFNQLWKKSIEISHSDIEKIKENTFLKTLTPREIYYKLLIEYFGEERISIDSDTEALFPKGYKALKYQIDAIADGINKLDKYNGVFLSDVVGLGKTLIATIIARKMELMSKFGGHILVACPPHLKAVWQEHFKLVGYNRNCEFFSHDEIKKITNPQDYGLVIVDESHRFKSSSADRYKALERICKDKTLYANKKVILLSATPQNNSPEDIRNQIYLFQDSRNCNIGTHKNLESFFSSIIKEYNQIKEELKDLSHNYLENSAPIKTNQAKLKDLATRMREELLKHIMIRRTRGDIQKGFPEDMRDTRFPKIQPITELEYKLSPEVEELSRKTLALLDLQANDIGEYGYYRYLIYPNLTAEGKAIYRSNMGDKKNDAFYDQTAERLRGLMKTLLFKRFESSISAFISTLYKQVKSTESLLKMLENKEQVIIPKDNLSNLDAYYKALEEEKQGTLEQFIEQYESKVMHLSASDFQEDFADKLDKDLKILNSLIRRWEAITEDAKLNRLVDEIRKLQGKKILIFTEATTTAKYLGAKLQDIFPQYGILQVDSDNRKQYEQAIRENFDANYSEPKDIYNILISTDTLSEGVNMHRSNILINYDAPWNATRLMQRAGRINRLGTPHSNIYLYNFKPSALGDEILKFSKQIFQKLQSFHYTLGEDSTIYSEIEEMGNGGLLTSQDEESTDPEVEFLKDIRKLKEENPKEFSRIAKIPAKSRTLLMEEDKSYFYFKQKRQERFKDTTQESTNDFFYSVESTTNKDLIPTLESTIQRVKFEDMASYLKDRINSKVCEKAIEMHYHHAQEALKYHEEELHIQGKSNPSTLPDTTSNAMRAVKSNIIITQEQRDLLLDALKKGKLSAEDEKELTKGQEVSKIIAIAESRTHEDEGRLKDSKIYYPKPVIQLSATSITKE